MERKDFYYNLPEELIAQTPIEPRDSSRLLVYDRSTDKIEHKHFYDITDYLKKGDVLVVNNTKVIKARIFGLTKTGAEVEILLLKRLDLKKWEVISKPAKRLKIGTEINFSDRLGGIVREICDNGIRVIEFVFNGVFEEILDEIGNMPLPPYIKEKLSDSDRYQTVYCKRETSSAAPTAGLHFTVELLEKIKSMGVEIVEVMLSVGLGTFRPVKEDLIENHKMHSEYFEITSSAAEIINRAKAEGRRVICVGTTSVRVLESALDEKGNLSACAKDTDIFIYPGYKFKVVDAIITNFHLPESTLIMLVSAFLGREKTLEIYNTAVKERYRFFSFGDAMLIV